MTAIDPPAPRLLAAPGAEARAGQPPPRRRSHARPARPARPEPRRRRRRAWPGTSPIVVQVDQNQIQQALTNLVVNAIQAMPNGGGSRSRSSSARPAPGEPRRPGGRLSLRRGHGRGQRHRRRRPAAHLRALLHHQGRRRGHGPRALGRLRHRAASTAAGSTVESEVGRGQPLLHLPPPRRRHAGGGGGVMKGRVLVVDDDRSMCEVLERRLREHGFEVRWTHLGQPRRSTLLAHRRVRRRRDRPQHARR